MEIGITPAETIFMMLVSLSIIFAVVGIGEIVINAIAKWRKWK